MIAKSEAAAAAAAVEAELVAPTAEVAGIVAIAATTAQRPVVIE